MRLDKFLAHHGYGSRKEIKQFLKKTEVTVNGKRVKDGKQAIVPTSDIVRVQDEVILYQEYVYWMLHKPSGYISATEDQAKTVLDLLKSKDAGRAVFPVGRLDKDTEGLLLLTDDGQLAHELLSPKKHVNKVYEATIEGVVTGDDVHAFKKGIVLEDDYQCKPAKLEILQVNGVKTDIRITIQEGKYHQIKRMFLAVDKKVIYLKRIQMGSLQLDENLARGEYRPLTVEELEQLSKKRLEIQE